MPLSRPARRRRSGSCIAYGVSPKRLRPHGHGEANAARGRQLAVLDTLTIARVEGGLGIDRWLFREQEQVPPDKGHGRIREAKEARDRRRERVRQASLAELEVRGIEDAGL